VLVHSEILESRLCVFGAGKELWSVPRKENAGLLRLLDALKGYVLPFKKDTWQQ
jgi:hypothetical protein